MSVLVALSAAVGSALGMIHLPALGDLWGLVLALSAFFVVGATEAAD